MRDLNYQLKQLCRRNVDGSFSTRADRLGMLLLVADQLHDLGFRHLKLYGLKPKHIEALVKHWQFQNIAAGTQKNRMAALRWWTEKIDKPGIIAAANEHYGIADRQLVHNVSKAQTLIAEQLAAISESSIRFSLELQQAFGLRREEILKFSPSYADKGDRIQLKASWTKGGKAREIPVLTAAQRELLNRIHQFAGRGSLIPCDRRYIEQLRIYERHTARVGLSKMHGLRHHYAQWRYETLTGWKAPAAGGPTSKQLTAEQKIKDRAARLIISRELGHGREQITAVYLFR